VTIKLIVGLANNFVLNGLNRDNVGAWWIHALCKQNHVHLQPFKTETSIAAMRLTNGEFNCAITSTHSHNAGTNVAALKEHLKIESYNILVVHDEINFTPGTMHLKCGADKTSFPYNRGHKGVTDITKSLGSEHFHRLRIGIGKPEVNEPLNNYLEKAPDFNDKDAIENAIQQSFIWLPYILEGNWSRALNGINSPKPDSSPFRPRFTM
jgi:PTH1 family peptidyl-tRNA hydrolase